MQNLGLERQVEMVYSDDPSIIQQGVLSLRKHFSSPTISCDEVDCVIATGAVSKVLELLVLSQESDFQAECAWFLTNICSGETHHVRYVAEQAGIEIFIRFLDSDSQEVLEQVIWAIANIAGDCAEFQLLCLENDCMKSICEALKRVPGQRVQGQAIWAMSNLLGGDTKIVWSQVSEALPTLKMIWSSVFTRNKQDCLDCLSSLSKAFPFELIEGGIESSPLRQSIPEDTNLSMIIRSYEKNLSAEEAGKLGRDSEYWEVLKRLLDHPDLAGKGLESFCLVLELSQERSELIERIKKSEVLTKIKVVSDTEKYGEMVKKIESLDFLKK